MGRHWVYILKNKTDEEECNAIYVGETERLYRRFKEHMVGKGSITTLNFESVQLIGLYNIANNDAFEKYHSKIETFKDGDSYYIWDLQFLFRDWRNNEDNDDYDFLKIENLITEICIFLNKNNNIDVKGGKYTRDICYKDKIESMSNHRPICKCGLPAEVFLSKKEEIWFKCAVANATWVDFEMDDFSVAEPCSFLQKYINDNDIQEKYQLLKKKLNSDSVKSLPKINKVGNENKWEQEMPCCICKETRYSPVFSVGFRPICKICVDERYDKIKFVKVKPTFSYRESE